MGLIEEYQGRLFKVFKSVYGCSRLARMGSGQGKRTGRLMTASPPKSPCLLLLAGVLGENEAME